MKLIYRITIRLSIALLPILLLWATVFYYSMVNEINDETDDSLEDYAEMLIRRTLTNGELPEHNNGSNNTYSIEPLPHDYSGEHFMRFEDEDVYHNCIKKQVNTIFAFSFLRYFKLKLCFF